MGTIKHAHQTSLPNDASKDVSANAWNDNHTISLSGADLGTDPALTGTASASAFNATTGLYQFNGANLIHILAAIYTTLCDAAGADKLYIGAAGDPTTYVRNSTVRLQTIGANDLLVASVSSVQIPLVPLELSPITAPSAPASGWRLYCDSGDANKLKAIAANGTIATLGTP